MAELVIKIPEDLKREIDRTPFIDWSKVAKQKRVMSNLLTKNATSRKETELKEWLKKRGKSIEQGIREVIPDTLGQKVKVSSKDTFFFREVGKEWKKGREQEAR